MRSSLNATTISSTSHMVTQWVSLCLMSLIKPQATFCLARYHDIFREHQTAERGLGLLFLSHSSSILI